jgi:hypothetical protein
MHLGLGETRADTRLPSSTSAGFECSDHYKLRVRPSVYFSTELESDRQSLPLEKDYPI